MTGLPSVIHSASMRQMDGASLIHTAEQHQRPLTSGVSPTSDMPSGTNDIRPLIACLMPTFSLPTIVG